MGGRIARANTARRMRTRARKCAQHSFGAHAANTAHVAMSHRWAAYRALFARSMLMHLGLMGGTQASVLCRWPYCTGGRTVQVAVLYGWPYCMGGHIAHRSNDEGQTW